MTHDHLRYGVVGCAGMGTTHADGVEATDGARLVACADVVPEHAEAFADEYGCAAYTDHGAMAADADLDVASVCTPNGTHADVVVDLARAGIDVLCEKPLDVRPERVDRMIRACEEAGTRLGCIYQRRTMGGARLAREAVETGTIGDLVLGDVQVKWFREDEYFDAAGWRGTLALDGGVLFTQALHGIDLLQWVGGGVERVCAGVDTLHQSVEVPDTAVLAVEFSNGAFGTVAGSTTTYPEYPITLQVHGTAGTVRWHEDELDEYTTRRGDGSLRLEPFHHGVGIEGQVRDFVDAVRTGREPMVPPGEARKALDVVFAAQVSADRGEWVAVEDVRDGTVRPS